MARLVQRALPVAAALACLALPIGAQEEAEEERDRGFIAGLIEDNLSAPGLSVRIDGFEGALSSAASLELLQVSDDEGVWLRLEDVVLDWNRSALLRGRLEVEELSAALIEVVRAPLPAEGVEALPEAGATGFSLPNLPVSIDVEALRAERIELGESLLGQALALDLEASAQLADGAGSATIAAQRLDGPDGRFDIAVAYGGEGQPLSVDIDVEEAEGGIAATLLQLPGAPAIRLTVDGEGPLDAFAADIALSSDGEDRLAGAITLDGTEEGRRFDVDLGGDVTPLFAPDYRDFFGTDVGLVARGVQRDDGGLLLETLDLTTRALALQGNAELGPDGWPVAVDVTGRLASEDGEPVTLPTAEAPLVQSADLVIDYDAAASEEWVLSLEAEGYSSAGLVLDAATVSATGVVSRADGAVDAATAAIEAALSGLGFQDPALVEAVGDAVELTADVEWQADGPVRLSDLALAGTGLALTGEATVEAADETDPLTVRFDLGAAIEDLARLAAISGQDLSGEAEATLSGAIAPVAGTFDIEAEAITRDLAVGIAQADPLIGGETVLSLAARRTAEGTFLDAFDLANDAISAEGSASILAEDAPAREDGERGAATFNARLADGAPLDPRLEGPITLSADVTEAGDGVWSGNVEAEAPQGVTLTAEGELTGETPDIEFAASVPDISAFAEGVPGALDLSGRAFARDGIWSLDAEASGPYGVEATVSGPVTGDAARIAFAARLPELAEPVPALAEIPALRGAVALEGELFKRDEQWVVDTSVEAPSDISLRARGVVTGPGRVDRAGRDGAANRGVRRDDRGAARHRGDRREDGRGLGRGTAGERAGRRAGDGGDGSDADAADGGLHGRCRGARGLRSGRAGRALGRGRGDTDGGRLRDRGRGHGPLRRHARRGGGARARRAGDLGHRTPAGERRRGAAAQRAGGLRRDGRAGGRPMAGRGRGGRRAGYRGTGAGTGDGAGDGPRSRSRGR